MVFEEAVKTVIIALVGSGAILAYCGFKLKDQHVPLRLLFLAMAVLMMPLSIGISLRGLEEQAGGLPTTAQADIIGMVDTLYGVSVWIFVFTVGYLVVVFIRWTLELMRNYKQIKLSIQKGEPQNL